MPRGAKADVMKQSEGLVNDARAQTLMLQGNVAEGKAQNAGLRGSLLPQYQDMASGKVPSWEQAAIGINEGTGREALERRAARTRNSAGTPEAMAQMGRDRASAIGEASLRQRATGLAGQSDIYGVDQRLLGQEVGLPVDSLRTAVGALGPAASVAGQPGFWERIAEKGLGAVIDRVSGSKQIPL